MEIFFFVVVAFVVRSHENEEVSDQYVTYVAAGEIGAVVGLQAHRRVDVVFIDVPSPDRERRIDARPVVGGGEGAVVEDRRPFLVGRHAVAPQELEFPLIVHVVVKQRVAELYS